MTFSAVCRTSDIAEGGMGLFHVGKKSVLLVWPQGSALKAYRGRCPHADMPLTAEVTQFDGVRLTCAHHNWGFDTCSGKCVTHAVHHALHAYPLRVEGDEVQVDVGPLKPPRATASNGAV